MLHKVARVRTDEFRSYLLSQADDVTHWKLDDNSFDEYLPHGSPLDVDEVMHVIDVRGEGDDYIYILDLDPDNEHDEEAIDWDNLPEVKADELWDYKPAVSGKDLLYFATTTEHAANFEPTTLLPVEIDEEEFV